MRSGLLEAVTKRSLVLASDRDGKAARVGVGWR